MTSIRIAGIVLLLGASLQVALFCIDPLGSPAGAAVTCAEGKAPGWLNAAGEATSCVDDGSAIDLGPAINLGPAGGAKVAASSASPPPVAIPAAAPLLTRDPTPNPNPNPDPNLHLQLQLPSKPQVLPANTTGCR